MLPRNSSSPLKLPCSTGGRWLVRQRLQCDDGREYERLVLIRLDLDPVGVADPKPLLGDMRHCVAVALDLVLMVDDVPVGFEILPAWISATSRPDESSSTNVSRTRKAFPFTW